MHERTEELHPGTADSVPVQASLDEALALAVQVHKHGRLPEAERMYRAILEAEPGHVEALHFLGLLRHHAGDSAAGALLIARAIARCPEYADAHSNLGNLLRAQGRLAEAAGAYRRAIALAPHAQAYNNLGVVLKDQGQLDEALSALQQAIALDPERGDAHFNLANVLTLQNRPEQAQGEYCRAIELEPLLVYAYEALGRTLRELGRDAEAIEVVRQLIVKLPDSPIARHMWAAWSGRDVPPRASDGYVQQMFDGFADGFDFLLKILEYQAPQLIAAAIARELASPQQQLDQGRYAEALAALQQAIALDPNRGDAHFNLGNVLTQQDRREEAQCEYRRAIELEPTLVLAYDALARALQNMGRREEAIEVLQQLLDKSPGNPVARHTRDALRKERDKPVAGLVVSARRPR